MTAEANKTKSSHPEADEDDMPLHKTQISNGRQSPANALEGNVSLRIYVAVCGNKSSDSSQLNLYRTVLVFSLFNFTFLLKMAEVIT
jgi:hypothetical protein